MAVLKSRVFAGILVAAGVLSAATALSQENILRPLPGAKQLGIMGNWASSSGATTHVVVVEGGYYVTDSLVAIARVGLFKHSPEQRAYLIGARYEMKSRGQSVPYIVAGIEFHDGQRPQTTQARPKIDSSAGPKSTFIEAGAGINFMLNRSSAAFIELVGFKSSGVNDIGADLQIGLRIFFK